MMANHSISLEGKIGASDEGNYSFLSPENMMDNDTDLREKSMLANVGYSLHVYGTPVIIIVGLIGNIVSLIVFVRTPLRQLSSSVYLAALAVVDTAFLVQLFVAWLGYVRIYLFHTQGICQIGIYTSYVSAFLSVWFITSFTVERYIAVCYPLRRQDMCTAKRAKIVVLVLTVFALVAYSFAAWTTGIKDNICTAIYFDLVQKLNNVDTVITLIIPSFAIFVMNIRIMYKIAYFFERRDSMTANGQLSRFVHQNSRDSLRLETSNVENIEMMPSANSCNHTRLMQAQRTNSSMSQNLRNRSQIRVTKLLLVVSSVFLILNLPSHALRIYSFIMQLLDLEPTNSETVQELQQFFILIYYLNFSVNFFLYSLCGKNFRRALHRLGLQCQHQIHCKYCHSCDCVRQPGSFLSVRRSDSTPPLTISSRQTFSEKPGCTPQPSVVLGGDLM